MQLSLRQLFATLFILFVGLLGTSLLQAWTGPTGTAPGSNVAAPINAGAIDQVKNAGLSINALTVFGSAYIQNKLGIGNPSPAVSLDVNGTIKIGNAGELCQAVSAGAVRYNSTSNTMEYCNGTVWGPFSQPVSNSMTIASNTYNYNLYVAAGSPPTPVTLTLTINSGVTVVSLSTGVPALDTGNFPAGSVITIVNNGTIIGAGGAGGAGGDQYKGIYGGAGSAGGTALSLGSPVTITNNGLIEGGGGGGGGGSYVGPKAGAAGGGGGVGGCGNVAGPGGTGGGAYQSGSNGSPGSTTAGGGGGGAAYSYYYATGGGAGGACGAAGGNPTGVGGYPGAGGAAGAAVVTNGNTITWIAVNDGTHVLGVVQ